jgi:hypothetical protein
MHKKISNLFNRISFALLAFVPATVWANDALLDAEFKAKRSIEAVKHSPIVGMVMYSGGAIVVFVGLIIVVFLLIMLLNNKK